VKRVVLTIVTALLLTGCKGSAPPGESEQVADTKLNEWSWLPSSNKHEAEIAQIPKDAEFDLFIPKNEALVTKSAGWGRINTYLSFIPTDKESYLVSSGALVSRLGKIEKKAKWGDWDFLFDTAGKDHVGWGYSLTSGDILLPRTAFASPPADASVQNSFEIEAFGDSYALIHLDPAKGHRLCFLKFGRIQLPTAGYIGTKAEVDGRVLERKTDGWYLGSKRMSQASGSSDLERIYASGKDKPDSSDGHMMVCESSARPSAPRLSMDLKKVSALYNSKILEFPLDSGNQRGSEQKKENVLSEGWLAVVLRSPPDAQTAPLPQSQAVWIAGCDGIAYMIESEKRWGFFTWKE
jgi:hypothetical protein